MSGQRATWILAGAGAFAIVAVAAAAFVVLAGDDDGPATQTVTRSRAAAPVRSRVPSVVDVKLRSARKRLRSVDLRSRVKRRRYDDSTRGTVLAQSPDPGEEVEPGTRVALVLSRGPRPPRRPYGPLGTSSVGPVKVGMSPGTVSKYFVAPDSKEDVNLGGGATPQINWTYRLGDGNLRLQFDVTEGHNEVTGYTIDSSAIKTVSGYGVGTSISTIKQRYGDQLTDSPFGGACNDSTGGCVLSENSPGSQPALTFYFEGDTITSVSGGNPQAAGE